jgi:hypothetical protein
MRDLALQSQHRAMLFGELVQSVVYGVGVICGERCLLAIFPRIQIDVFDPPAGLLSPDLVHSKFAANSLRRLLSTISRTRGAKGS